MTSLGNVGALQASIVQHSRAYALHPRNRDAVTALRPAADELLVLAGNDPQKRQAVAQMLQENSDYFRKYTPAIEAARQGSD